MSLAVGNHLSSYHHLSLRSGGATSVSSSETRSNTLATVAAVIPNISWIVDSGAGTDIVSDDVIKGKQRKMIRDKACPETLSTANGLVEISKEITLEMKSGLHINALVMENSPCVLSLGQRCMTEGYRFVWEPFQNPVLTAPDGQDIPMDVHSFVPFIEPTHALPIAPDGAADGKPPSGSIAAAEKQAREDNKARLRRDASREATLVGSTSSTVPEEGGGFDGISSTTSPTTDGRAGEG